MIYICIRDEIYNNWLSMLQQWLFKNIPPGCGFESDAHLGLLVVFLGIYFFHMAGLIECLLFMFKLTDIDTKTKYMGFYRHPEKMHDATVDRYRTWKVWWLDVFWQHHLAYAAGSRFGIYFRTHFSEWF